MRRRLLRLGNRMAVWMYERSDGRWLGAGKVLLLTVPGRRTGVPRRTCVRFLDVPEGHLVWGTASGAPRDPDWVRNLRHADEARVQVGGTTCRVRPRELTEAERDAAWSEIVLARAPEVRRYAAKAGRVIPVVVLQPL
jgi:deazaflavin-dependent oxidoreductase (nitroreductase family)